ncbi:MAG: hypothetical protein R2854_27330 [Caldilineaceae bacterium]
MTELSLNLRPGLAGNDRSAWSISFIASAWRSRPAILFRIQRRRQYEKLPLGLRSLFTKVIMIVLLLAVGTSALLLILGKQGMDAPVNTSALSVAIFTGFNSLR